MLKKFWGLRKKHRFQVVAHIGVSPLKLNSSREDVRKIMHAYGHEPSYFREYMDYFIDNSIQVEFDLDQRASFIGVAAHRDIEVSYRGVNIFENSAEDIFELIGRREESAKGNFQPSEYLFEQQIISLWDADQQYHLSGGKFRVWGQVGVGNEAYLQAIKNSRSR